MGTALRVIPSSSTPRLPQGGAGLTLADYAGGVLGRNRTILARAITLIESNRPDHQEMAQELLNRLLPQTGRSIRVGITGVPSVGKSALIEALGCRLTAEGHRLAVLSIDPSSVRSGGNLLGDKTRMVRLSADPNAFIHPSPARHGRLCWSARQPAATWWRSRPSALANPKCRSRP